MITEGYYTIATLYTDWNKARVTIINMKQCICWLIYIDNILLIKKKNMLTEYVVVKVELNVFLGYL